MKIAQLLLILTLILSPLYILRSFFIIPFINFYVPFTFLEVLILVDICWCTVVFLRGKYSLQVIQTSLDPFIGLLGLAALLAIFTSYDLIGGLGILKAYFIEPILFYYCLIFVRRQAKKAFLIEGLLGAGVWLGLLALLQKFLGVGVFAWAEQIQGRVTGVFNSANSLALFLGPLTVVSFSGFFRKYFRKKLLYISLFFFFLLILFLTKSRGGLAALVCSLMIVTYAVLTLKKRVLQKFWFVVPITVLVGLLVFFAYFYQNYNFFQIDYSRPYTSGDTLQIRYFIWSGTVALLKEHFLFGAGLNGFKTLYSNQYRPVQYQEQIQYPHNILLTFWSEMGLFGLFSFLLLVVSAYGILIRNLVKSSQPIVGAALIGMISYWMLHGMVDVPYFKNDLSVEFWSVIAMIELWRSKTESI